jgi:hypothetical protein
VKVTGAIICAANGCRWNRQQNAQRRADHAIRQRDPGVDQQDIPDARAQRFHHTDLAFLLSQDRVQDVGHEEARYHRRHHAQDHEHEVDLVHDGRDEVILWVIQKGEQRHVWRFSVDPLDQRVQVRLCGRFIGITHVDRGQARHIEQGQRIIIGDVDRVLRWNLVLVGG